jgi:hypothetical protein
MSGYTPVAGDRVRITRYRWDGKIQFVKTGHVGPTVRPYGFDFTEDMDSTHPGMRVMVSSDTDLPQHMKGWSQTTERMD